mgnify:CR=1 FL=1
MNNKIKSLQAIKDIYHSQEEKRKALKKAVEQIENCRTYSDEYKRQLIKEQYALYDKEATEKRAEALDLLNRARAEEKTTIDSSNAALMCAISVINTLGDKLDGDDIKAITRQFSGDIGSLNTIKKICEVKGISTVHVENMIYDVDNSYQSLANNLDTAFQRDTNGHPLEANFLIDNIVNKSAQEEITPPAIAPEGIINGQLF